MGRAGQPTGRAARDVWAAEAYEVLVEVARTYDAVITYKELGEEIQARSGLPTDSLLHTWIGPILGQVVREAHHRGDPPLTALVVHLGDGKVGSGYKEVLAVAGQPPVEDELEREYHAAESRLECYRRFGATLPPDGGRPRLAPRLETTLARRSEREREVRPPRICARCFLQLPASGLCDSCD
ncbi:hypothetical protein ACFQ8C_25980 [Streptomyces sp. NPDC056503]|uniref:hypothetical protein n=1 Tax=Streptomyces sp. NPDC056503 TaxID=3345842 RepID=UPI0036A2DE68